MKPFKWIKKHPFESAAIAAALIATGGSAAGMFGPAAAGAAGLGAAEVGAGAGIAGGTLGLEFGGMTGLEALGAGVGGVGGAGGSLLGGAGASLLGSGAQSALLGNVDLGSSMAFGEYPTSSLLGNSGPSGFSWTGPTAADDSVGNISGNSKAPWRLGGKDALRLASMMNSGQQDRPMGAPLDMGNPMQRQAMLTQEQITKKWLLQNDPSTYARIYGSPQGASYG